MGADNSSSDEPPAEQIALLAADAIDGGCSGSPRAWQRFYMGYRERFVDDCVVELTCGATIRLLQAPSARQAGQAGRARRGAGIISPGPLDKSADPALTGTTVWDGAVVLAQYLTGGADGHGPALPGRDGARTVLELGAGSGTVALALLAARRAARVALTDLPDMLPHLSANVAHNAAVLPHGAASAVVAPLRWGEPTDVANLRAAMGWTARDISAAPVPLSASAIETSAAAAAAAAAAAGDIVETTAEETAAAAAAVGETAATAAVNMMPDAQGEDSSQVHQFDVIVGGDLVYYSYQPATPHSRLLLTALAQLAGPDTHIYLALSLHHNPGEVSSFLRWARETWGFDVRAVRRGVPAEYDVSDVLIARMQLRDASAAAAAVSAARAGTLHRDF